ncbi:uncharacterized protein LOC135496760 [Lineus longissimus]|uniref:uncharacterized protein LOC135496760 n=1 Tax=Lineus longissimus TaxID=88925 RepID=UPI002B4E2BBA
MGVQGLYTYLMRHQEEVVEVVDLVEKARQRNGIELLVDFYAFEHLVLKSMWKSLGEVRRNDYLRLAGGEYETIDQYFSKFVKDLRAVDISLVFYVDGAKGSSTYQTQNKLDTWKSRYKNDVKKLNTLLDVCSGKTNISSVPYETAVRPVLLEVQVFQTLRQCGCEIHQVSFGEADYAIARDLMDRPKAYAVLGNDTDFCIFRESVFIHVDLFDMESDMGLGGPYSLPEKPLRLVAGILTQERVSELLGFKEHRLLIELSIICGNDFTGPVIRSRHIKENLDVKDHKDMKEIAGWVRHYQMVDNHPMIKQEAKKNKQLMNAIQFSRQFYCLMYSQPEVNFKGQMSHDIEEGVLNGTYSPNIMSMHNNFYWHRMLLEDTKYGHPCIEWALAELRSFIYKLVLPRDEAVVVEYGRTPYDEDLATSGMMSCDRNFWPINQVHNNKIFQNLRTFHLIITHQEGGEVKEFFNRYGRRTGFLVYVLRYFLLMNRGKNLNIEDDEYLDLVAGTFARGLNLSFYQGLGICPSVRCVTLGNWFQDLYRHAYEFLAKILLISHECPTPKEIFNGSVWTAFYMTGRPDFSRRRPLHLTNSDCGRIYRDKQNILKEKRHMIRYMVEGYMQFNTSGW